MWRAVKILAFSLSALLVSLTCHSCSGNEEAPVSQENMKEILYEMFIVEDLLYDRGDIRAQSDSAYVYLPILEKYGYSEDDFHNAIDYYLRHIGEFIDLSTSVKERLEAEQSMLDSALLPAQKKKTVIDTDTLSAGADTVSKVTGKRKRALDKKKLKELEEKFK